MTRHAAPPAHPRRRRWNPPSIGSTFVRSADQKVFTVRQVYRRDQQVLLQGWGERVYVFASELDRDFEQVGA